MANQSDFQIIEEAGEYFVAVPTEIDGNPTTWSDYYYIFPNPVTLEEDVIDDETGQVTGTQYVPSKLEMRKERVRFLESGGNRVIKTIDGDSFWLIKMPEDFLIDSGYQPGNENPEVEDWNIGGAYGDNTILPFIPQRTAEYANNPDFSSALIIPTWGQSITGLINEKY